MLKNRLFIVGVLVLALALVLGCTLTGKPSQAPEAAQPTKAPEATQPTQPTKAAPQQPTPAAEQATPTSAPEEAEELTLESMAAGVEKLNSYKARWTAAFEGKDEQGNPVKGKIEALEEYSKNPPGHRVVIKGEDPETGEVQLFEMLQVEGKNYILTPEGQCLSMTATEEMERMISPEEMGGISGAKFVGMETVNGINCKHYTFDEKAFVGLSVARAKGHVWVAPEGYVVKVVFDAEGKGTIFGFEKGEGKLHWEYEVTDVNKPITIEVPEACTKMMPEDIPIMPDASETTSMAGMISYTTEKPFDEVVEFYKTEMAARGWKAAEGSIEMEGMVMLSFTKDDRTAQVMITTQEGKVQVAITVEQ